MPERIVYDTSLDHHPQQSANTAQSASPRQHRCCQAAEQEALRLLQITDPLAIIRFKKSRTEACTARAQIQNDTSRAQVPPGGAATAIGLV